MSRFENSYLAESVGYNNGHAHGISEGINIGMEHGYTKGWNEATMHGNAVVEERNQLIDRIYGANKRLGAENTQLKQQLQLQQEQAQTLRAEYEAMFKSFLGVVAIARPAMKAVARLPFAERKDIYYEYGEQAIDLLTREYVLANRFPANQALIFKHLPIANQVFGQTEKQLQAQAINSENNPENNP